MVKPVVAYAYQQSVLKEEDVLLVNPEQSYPAEQSSDASSSLRHTSLHGFSQADTDWPDDSSSMDPSKRPGSCGVFVVCDGHNGATAARYIADQLPSYLDDLLPPGPPPEETNVKMYSRWRHGVQRALTVSLTLIHRAFAGLGVQAGCTVTIVLQHDWLLTTACLGDSRAVLDTGRSVTVLTEDHRVATHQQERRRLEQKGSVIAPVNMNGGGPAIKKGSVGAGPLRLWPGGLCLSRAIGDFDVGDSVLCLPFISQVVVPESGGRLVIASDGVWDAFDRSSRVTSIHRQHSTQAAPQRVVDAILMAHDGLRDDTSLIVVDIMPPGKTFKECTGPRFSAVSGCMCMSSSKTSDKEPLPAVVLGRADIASYAGLMADKPSFVPSWFTRQLQVDLLESGEQAMVIWSRASGMRRVGKVPSIVDFERQLGSALPEYTGLTDEQEGFNEDPATSIEDLSVRMGTVAHSLIDPAVLRRKPGQLFPEDSSHHSSDANPSVRFGDAIATDSEDFGAKFGHYKKERQRAPPAADSGAMQDTIGTSTNAAGSSGPSHGTKLQGTSDDSHMMRSALANGAPARHDPDGSTQGGGGIADGVTAGSHPTPGSGTPGSDPLKRKPSGATFVSADDVKTVSGGSIHQAETAPPQDFNQRRNSIGAIVVPSAIVGPARTSIEASPGCENPGVESSDGRSRRRKSQLTALQKASQIEGSPNSRVRGNVVKSVAFSGCDRD